MIDLKSALQSVQYNGGTSPMESLTRIIGTQQQNQSQGQDQNQQGQQGQLAEILAKIMSSGGGMAQENYNGIQF